MIGNMYIKSMHIFFTVVMILKNKKCEGWSNITAVGHCTWLTQDRPELDPHMVP